MKRNLWQSVKGFMWKKRSMADPIKWLVDWWGGPESAAGVNVTQTTAMQLSAVYGCVKVLSETIGSIPLLVYRRVAGGKDRAMDHPLYPILHDSPNPEMTAMQWRETAMMHLGLRGNSYSEIVLDNGGRVKELWPLTPQRVRLHRMRLADGRAGPLKYLVNLPDGRQAVVPQENMLHIRAMSLDGLTGMSPLEAGIEVIGLGIAGQTLVARFFANDATPGGVLEHPGTLSAAAQKRLRDAHNKEHQGIDKKWRVKILEEGMKWNKTANTAKDAQLLESRKFQVEEIARFYRMPLHKIQSLDKATFSNIEHQSIEFLSDTIYPWLKRFEQEISLKLLTPDERKIFIPEFLIDGLLRADIKTRYEAFAIGRQWGWLSADDVRTMENMNELPDGKGKIYMVPMNMMPAEMAGTINQKKLIIEAMAAAIKKASEETLAGDHTAEPIHTV